MALLLQLLPILIIAAFFYESTNAEADIAKFVGEKIYVSNFVIYRKK